MSDQYYRLKVAGRILDALYSSSNDAVAQGMLIFGTAGAEVCVLGPGGDVVWTAAAGHRHAPFRPGAFPGPGAAAVGESH
jgi:hypothetical protein